MPNKIREGDGVMKKIVLGLAAASLMAGSTLAAATTVPLDRAGVSMEEAEAVGADGKISTALLVLLFGAGAVGIIALIEGNNGENGDLPISP